MAEQSHTLSVMLGQAVRDLLYEQHMPATKLAEALGVDGSIVSRTLNGEIAMTVDRMLAIEGAMGVQPGSLLRRAGLIPPGMEAVEDLQERLATLGAEVAAMQDKAAAVLLRLAAATGARRGELCALRWRHIDLDGAVVRIERAIIETGPGKATWSEKTTKTKNQRKVSLDADTVAVMRAHLQACQERADHADVPLLPAHYVFAANHDSTAPMRPSAVTQAVRRLRDRLGLAGVKLHDFRHAAATQMIAAGVDVVTVANRLGHADPALTLRVYSHALAAKDKEAGDLMGRLYGAPDATNAPDT